MNLVPVTGTANTISASNDGILSMMQKKMLEKDLEKRMEELKLQNEFKVENEKLKKEIAELKREKLKSEFEKEINDLLRKKSDLKDQLKKKLRVASF